MKKINITTTTLLFLASFTNTVAMQSHDSLMLSSLHNQSQHQLVLHGINTTQSLQDNIKAVLQLRKSCTHLNTFLSLKKVGKSFRHYTQQEKDATLKVLLKGMSDSIYWNRRSAALMLIQAGADNAANKDYSLLERATHRNDIEAITVLFANNANPNQKDLFNPIIFSIKTVDIATIFIAHGLDINTNHTPYLNILERNINNNDSSELVAFYIANGVNPKQKEPETGDYLFHKICSPNFFYCTKNPQNYINIAEVLLNAAPEMINAFNYKCQTPLDIAKIKIKEFTTFNDEMDLVMNLVTLFEKHGAKTARQLADES